MISKAAGLKLVKANKTFREQAEVSISMELSKHQVIAADEKVMTIVLKGRQSDHLDTMIYQLFQELVTTGGKGHPPQDVATKVCCNEAPQPQSLPSGPTVTWGNTLQTGYWGWELCGTTERRITLYSNGSSSQANDLFNALTHGLCN